MHTSLGINNPYMIGQKRQNERENKEPWSWTILILQLKPLLSYKSTRPTLMLKDIFIFHSYKF